MESRGRTEKGWTVYAWQEETRRECERLNHRERPLPPLESAATRYGRG